MADISIIICTYNPDERLLQRCLQAVSGLKRDKLQVECLLIDNNSNPPAGDTKIVQDFLQRSSWARLLVEPTAGLTLARILGYKNSTAPVIVFFDDDNEPEENYLLGTMDFVRRHPKAGIFGPGHITVDFIDGAKKSVSNFKKLYQEIHVAAEQYDTTTDAYPSCYPYGTGMVVRKEVMEAYTNRVMEGNLATLGRKGTALTGGEDVQIVWIGLRMGFAAGRTPLLSLKHLINGKKSNFLYLKRLAYGGGLSTLPARYEIFPEEKDHTSNTRTETRKSIWKICKIIAVNFYKPRAILLGIAWQAGYLQSIYDVNNKELTGIVRWIKRVLKLN
jgi:glycosyltransferase involved in cell wall biosynthesis